VAASSLVDAPTGSNPPSVMSSTSPLSPKHLEKGGLARLCTHGQGRGMAYWVNFHVGEFESTSTMVVTMPEKRHAWQR
jgi:hypothetical protein